MSLIMEQIEPEHPGLFVLEFRKIAEYNFVYTLASTNINHLAPNLVKKYDHKISDDIDYGFTRTRTELFPLDFARIA